MNRDEPVSRAELQLLIEDLRRLRERTKKDLEQRGVKAKELLDPVPQTEPVT